MRPLSREERRQDSIAPEKPMNDLQNEIFSESDAVRPASVRQWPFLANFQGGWSLARFAFHHPVADWL
jgi:hypothetical protein